MLNQLALAHAAACLEVAEIRLFRNAYRHWYGEDPSDRQLDRIFCAYLFCGTIPFWVADYTRRILARDSAVSVPRAASVPGAELAA